MPYFACFLLGLGIGVLVGVFTVGLTSAASHADECNRCFLEHEWRA